MVNLGLSLPARSVFAPSACRTSAIAATALPQCNKPITCAAMRAGLHANKGALPIPFLRLPEVHVTQPCQCSRMALLPCAWAPSSPQHAPTRCMSRIFFSVALLACTLGSSA